MATSQGNGYGTQSISTATKFLTIGKMSDANAQLQ